MKLNKENMTTILKIVTLIATLLGGACLCSGCSNLCQNSTHIATFICSRPLIPPLSDLKFETPLPVESIGEFVAD